MSYFENYGQSNISILGSDSWDLDIEKFLERTSESERGRLESELERIQDQLEKRSSVHIEILDELESKIDWYVERLEALYSAFWGNERKSDKNDLKERIEEFYHEIRVEKRSHWKDVQQLHQDRREILRELDEIDENILDLI